MHLMTDKLYKFLEVAQFCGKDVKAVSVSYTIQATLHASIAIPRFYQLYKSDRGNYKKFAFDWLL
jgi:hypothetical protein